MGPMGEVDASGQPLAVHVDSYAQMSPQRSYKMQFCPSPSPYMERSPSVHRSWERAGVLEVRACSDLCNLLQCCIAEPL